VADDPFPGNASSLTSQMAVSAGAVRRTSSAASLLADPLWRPYVTSPEIAAQLGPIRADGGLAVENHQTQVGAVKVQVAAPAFDNLVLAFVSCDFQPMLLGKRLDSGHRFPSLDESKSGQSGQSGPW
jgi:hypothetical protein